MKDFDQQLLRLKQALNTTEDQQVAAMLGLSKAAFAARKKRDAFPGDLLATLSLNRPELKIDVHWVMHGRTQQQMAVKVAASVARRGHDMVVREDVTPYDPSGHIRPLVEPSQPQDANALPPLSINEDRLLWRLRRCDPRDQVVVDALVQTLMNMHQASKKG